MAEESKFKFRRIRDAAFDTRIDISPTFWSCFFNAMTMSP